MELNKKEHIEQLLDEVDTFLLDLDGVVWRGNHPIPHVAETLSYLKKTGKHIFFITNNSSKSRKQVAEKFQKLGLMAEEHEIVSSSFGVAVFLKDIGFNRKAYVVGCSGIVQELKLAGIQVYEEHENPFPHNSKHFLEEDFAKLKVDPEIGAVLVGYDNTFNSFKLSYAMHCIKYNKDCLFIATNRDSTLPFGENVELPGAGAIVAAVSTAVSREPLVIGKPETRLLDLIEKSSGMDRKRAIMIGDRLETDIWFGNKGNVKTCAVLTGIVQRQDLEELQKSHFEAQDQQALLIPHYIMESFGDIFKLLCMDGEQQ